MRDAVASVVCAGAVLFMVGCSSDPEPVPVVGPVSEQASVPPQTDAPVVDMPVEESTSLEGDAETGMNQVPPGWPTDVPVPEGGQLQAWTEVDSTITASWLLLGTDAMPAGEAYARELSTGGWQGGPLVESADEPGLYTAAFTRDADALEIRVRPSAGSGEVDLTVEYGRG